MPRRIILIATECEKSPVWCARYTAPIPPLPMQRSITYGADRAAEVRIVAVVLIAGVDGRGRDELSRAGFGGEQRLDFGAQVRIAGAQCARERRRVHPAAHRGRAPGPL